MFKFVLHTLSALYWLISMRVFVCVFVVVGSLYDNNKRINKSNCAHVELTYLNDRFVKPSISIKIVSKVLKFLF